MPEGPMFAFERYAPDLASVEANVTTVLSNVLPQGDGYGPFPSLVPFSTALPGTCRGGFFARNSDGSVTVFAATATKLYQLNNSTFTWTDVSKGLGSYPAVPSGDNWQFAQYLNKVFAVQVNTVMQAFDLGISAQFADQPGSPPQASHIAIINGFVVLSGLLGFPNRIQWSDLNDPTQWTPGVLQSDFQDLPDGGVVHDIRGGDQYGIVFQDSAIRSMTYAPGSPVVFQILRIATNDGIFGQYSSCTASDNIYFYSPQGFKVIKSGGYPLPIGKEQVDRTFAADLDTANLQLFIGVPDPLATRVYWMYKSKQGITGFADKMIFYDWALQKWGLVDEDLMIEFVMYMSRPGATLEGLDAVAPGIISVLSAANNGSGAVRLTLSGLTAGTPPSNTNLNVENSVEIWGITGGVPAGNFKFTIINSTQIDLIGSTFTATGTGKIGGSLDQLPFSLDSLSTTAVQQLAAFDSTPALGFFGGPPMEAIIETPNQDLDDRVFISKLRPITDAPTCYGSIGAQTTAQTDPVYTTEQIVNAFGIIPNRVETRYARARLRIPAGVTWTWATGMKAPDAVPAQGDR